jgi:hypothetical protein
MDHFLNYAGFAETTFETIDPKQDNAERITRNFWLYKMGRVLLYYGVLVPYTYIGRPFLYYALDHKVPVTLFMAAFITSIAIVLLGIFASIPGLNLIFALMIAALIIVVAALPIFIHMVYKIANHLASLYHGNSIASPKMHDPKIDRIPELDLYDEKNSVYLPLTDQEINEYFTLMRTKLKGKEWITDTMSQTKRNILEKCVSPNNEEGGLNIKFTKAKAMHVKKTLKLIDQLGIDNQETLKQVKENYQSYQVGKRTLMRV